MGCFASSQESVVQPSQRDKFIYHQVLNTKFNKTGRALKEECDRLRTALIKHHCTLEDVLRPFEMINRPVPVRFLILLTIVNSRQRQLKALQTIVDHLELRQYLSKSCHYQISRNCLVYHPDQAQYTFKPTRNCQINMHNIELAGLGFLRDLSSPQPSHLGSVIEGLSLALFSVERQSYQTRGINPKTPRKLKVAALPALHKSVTSMDEYTGIVEL